ncbi:MAG: bifunctional diaminohydroxyphosphoribosylaminopyrimidine deaminase/5-amino-6-(5-phosphoribosylamino)uracil reductase RibD [Paenibacillaceae bacterium]|uniref:Riboflavin biosynthesis protein RibD n=1 Tax=Paenibacillus mellifer TaxID=2937794 RepID=A0A9X1XVD9_9BACL|nr:bifunctional diaminohydroxyphosphoribosylaminopyrimidine deaminase/5-amino-6-(5-phosphoribosylamino)uracil reductase RibD [Paenibacillus mellifer]MBW4838777.1 bifunctional diaminohydroxyphosphoribosylaminopyrimidine deaminase/5-amino-6-(5-phosphoribosylamino)uracil reductase RibD [Paenibacillaceae bacterium]MCK8486285.1 bifunctional diaminohydroxyphosphoribosylaminopyrimidine deaminase/5-amino-6-(5-phosphoribosylamino)uracil reductase RibD [Paenibacillus mellifer]
MKVIDDEYYMALALDMAERALGQTGTNPVVGALVIREGELVGLGTHLERGTPHAEVHALNMAGSRAEGSTVYVTLEPCSHHGLTPPCAERLIQEKVRRVVVACEDPNPLVAGRGIEMLRAAGIEVLVGVLRERALKLNRRFIKFISTGMPYVTIKSASTLDGKLASRTGDSKWISNEKAREIVHTMRHRHQAIMVGVSTIIADDPQLSTRLTVPGLSPVRVVADSTLRIPETAQILRDGVAPTWIITTQQADPDKAERLTELGAEILRCGSGPQVDLRDALVQLGQRGISSVLVEGGGRLNGSLLERRLVDEIVLFFAPKLVGGSEAPGTFHFAGYDLMREAVSLRDMEVEQIGDNVCIRGVPVWATAEVKEEDH